MPEYNIENWFWIVDGDESRFWSSAACSYVTELPAGAGVTRIVSEGELSDVLAVGGLAGPIVRVPERVSARQFRMQLRTSGLLDQVRAWVATQNPLLQDAFEYSGEFVRSEYMMASGFTTLGFSSQQVDQFFIEAAKL